MRNGAPGSSSLDGMESGRGLRIPRVVNLIIGDKNNRFPRPAPSVRALLLLLLLLLALALVA